MYDVKEKITPPISNLQTNSLRIMLPESGIPYKGQVLTPQQQTSQEKRAGIKIPLQIVLVKDVSKPDTK